jgi:hypothetical protein
MTLRGPWRAGISAEFEAIRDHVDDGDIVDLKPVNEPASSEIH